MGVRRFFGSTPDLAVDLGTANTLVFVRGQGVCVSEPSVVAIDQLTNEVHAVGEEAKQMIGRTPARISAVRPLRHGVIADFEMTEQMLRQFLGRIPRARFAHPRLVLCAPSGITHVERRALVQASAAAGAGAVALIEEPLAAAIGSGLPIAEPSATMIVDVGGGTSEVAVISMGGIVCSESLRVGGYDLDEAISAHLRTAHGIVTGTETAERLKISIGSAGPLETEETLEVRGRHVQSGMPAEITITSEEIRAALSAPLQQIIDAIRATLEVTPPELAGDIAMRGVHLAGGGSMLRGFPELVTAQTGMVATLVDEPLACVAKGAGESLEDFEAVLSATRSWTSEPRRAATAPAR
ncbi:MAG: cell shape determining protein MreB/Mrl family [Solirubrobacterales bacterium]|nr:cell shape determining protein MreB/Mrl family [Solirubrobacterales bacterium]